MRDSLLRIVLFLLMFAGAAQAQEAIHSQSVMKQEYLNPAYNSFKDYVSISFFTRNQWAGVGSSPKIYAANCYLPLQVSRMGIGLTVMQEDIGLRSISMLNASATNNIQLGSSSFLSFGYGLGLNYTAYDQDEIVALDEAYLNSDIKWTSIEPTLKLGMFYTNPHFFAGVSSNSVFGSVTNDSWYLPGIDVICGSMHRLGRNVFFRPDLIMKYYKSMQVIVNDLVPKESYAPPVFDLSLSFLVVGRLWLSTSHRFDMAQTFSTDFLVFDNLQVGYSFELGIGEGLNQFNSNSISLSYKIGKKSALGGFQKEHRYDYRNQFKYLYR
ncbi:MAG: PorP/SprF family type IX secretion system membrane protein [Mangrovibacterium sp.]